MPPFLIAPATVFAWWTMVAEAQLVATARLLALAGVLPMAPGDRRRMVAEKAPALVAAAWAGALVGMAGGSADAMARAALHPIRRRTRGNLRRLTAPRR